MLTAFSATFFRGVSVIWRVFEAISKHLHETLCTSRFVTLHHVGTDFLQRWQVVRMSVSFSFAFGNVLGE